MSRAGSDRAAPSPIVELDELIERLRCPLGGGSLRREADGLVSSEGHRYGFVDGVPDLRRPPARLRIDRPWYEPWTDLDALPLTPPAPAPAADLPYHLHAELAAVPGAVGDGRWVLEVGCGERQCEAYFTRRGFRYVGVDVDVRGMGPHLLSDAHNLPFVDESFDFYTSMAVYEHLVSPLQAALEAWRVLRPGGTFFGSAAFVYGFHDRASFHHMTHAGLLWTLRSAGFEVERIWPDWRYTRSIPEMAFGAGPGWPWRLAAWAGLTLLDRSFVAASSTLRRITGKRPLDVPAREAERAGSLSFIARKPVSGPAAR